VISWREDRETHSRNELGTDDIEGVSKTAESTERGELRQVAVIGQSHTLALLEGVAFLANRAATGVEVAFIADYRGTVVRALATESGFERLQPTNDLRTLVEAAASPQVFLLWWGNQISIRALIAIGPPFDVVLPSDTDQPNPAAEIVPCSAIQRYVRGSLDNDGLLPDVLTRAKAHAAELCFLAPPPPLPRHAIRERLAQSPHWVDVLDELGLSAADAPIVPDRIRARLNTLLLDVYESFAASHGATFLAPPDGVVDEMGMLREEYWGNDASHGNPAYGALYLEKVLERVNEVRRG
jgi:hypothetical protein